MKKMKKITLLFLLFFVAFLGAKAQFARGKITDAVTGAPIEGVTVTVKGKGNAATTNSMGEYSIEAAPGATLILTSIGYATKEIKADAGDVSLVKTSNTLGDVVVVGYGKQKRGNVTSAITTISGGQLTQRPLASTSMALQGLAPGVVVQQGGGQPGADGGLINIRGLSSITGNSQPLIVADGVEGVSLNDIDPNVIESITILKDAASTAVYGVRGTNGVILIKTKRGQAGKTSISFNSFVTKQTPTNFPETLSALDNILLSNEAVRNTGSNVLPYTQATIDQYTNQPADNLNVFNTDWKDLIFQNNGLLQNHNLILSGGSDKASFLVSGTYLNQQGIVVNNSFKKYDLRINGDINVTKRIKFTTDLSYTKATNTQPGGMAPTDIIQRGISMARNFPAKFGDLQYGDAGQSNKINPVAEAEASGIFKAETPTLSMRFGFNAEVFKNFVLEAAYTSRTSYTEAYSARGTYNTFSPNPVTGTYLFQSVTGDSTLNYTNNRVNTNQYFASASYSFDLSQNHSFKLQTGFQGVDNLSKSISGTRAGLLDPSRPYLNLALSNLQPSLAGGAQDNALAGYFGRFNYSYKDKYLLELSGRYDGSSRFSQILNNQNDVFSGASLGWVITKEKFMENVNFLDYAKIRLSRGSIGNQDIGGGNPNYPFIAQLNPGTAYYFNNQITRGSSLNGLPNENISWETSVQSNIGVDLSLLKNKLSVTFDVYRKNINNLILLLPIPLASGYAGTNSTVPANIGAMVNNGWELSTTYRNNVGKFNYSITGNLSDVRNKVLNTNGLDIIQGNQVSKAGFPARSYNLFRTNGLYQTGDVFNRPVNSTRTTGAGDVKFVDMDGNDTLNSKDRVLVGNNFPRYDYSLNARADFKGFDIEVFIFGVGKRDNYISGVGVEPFNGGNWIASGLTSALDRWTPTNTDAKYPRLFSGGNGNFTGSDFFLRDGSFMRIKNINLGYTFSNRILGKLKAQQLRLFVNTVNPFTFSNYEPGFDPEVTNTNGNFYPIMKTTTIGINLRF